ncbi:FUSC family protein [Roseimicrobium sp. ORNL1]|uniref:FUSC family protein n=1 Tax=Roseimicrobium sp. ORNL1 TaxID=2711231 RepID=UPI0013E1CD68|nr:FUSC family protein [Roseimicrobium sp. ORNL1]QIF02266.1 FUSC family protein [Roseimicrobium sp. ORNL1]
MSRHLPSHAGNEKGELPSLEDAVRTAVAATASFFVAYLAQMPEAYWATIATLVVMQSTLGATLTLSIGRMVATALGAVCGAVEAIYFGANLIAFTVAVFVMGLCSIALRLEKTAYRYAGITLAVVVLIPHAHSPWMTALHRFIEVSIGILVALVVAALWPEREQGALATSNSDNAKKQET